MIRAEIRRNPREFRAFIEWMAAIDSTSTEAQIRAAYLDNCGYAEDGDAAKAKAFATACRAMLIRGIQRIEVGGQRIELNPQTLENEITHAERFAAGSAPVSQGGAGARRMDFSRFRD